MKNKILQIDLFICFFCVLYAFCCRVYSPLFFIVNILWMIFRTNVPVLLMKSEKRAWIPISLSILLAVYSSAVGAFDSIDSFSYYVLHTMIGSELNRNLGITIHFIFVAWAFLFPLGYYVYLAIRKQLKRNDMPLKDIFGGALVSTPSLKLYSSVLVISILAMACGRGLQDPRASVFMTIAAPLFCYYLISRYMEVKASGFFLAAFGLILFYMSMYFYEVHRVFCLIASLAILFYAFSPLYRTVKCRHAAVTGIILFLSIVLPTFSVGLSVFNCIQYARYDATTVPGYNGIFFIEDHDGAHIGLRDRYRMFLAPEYDEAKLINEEFNGYDSILELKQEDKTLYYDITCRCFVNIQPEDID